MTQPHEHLSAALTAKRTSTGIQAYEHPQIEPNPPIFSTFHTWADRPDVCALAFDGQGHLWGCGTGGVVRWTLQGQISAKVWQSEHGLAGNDAINLFMSPDDQVAIGHVSGWISLYEHGTWRIVDTGTNFPVRAITRDSHETLWAATDLGLFDVNAVVLDTNIPAPPLSLLGVGDQLWMGAESGVYLHGGDSWQPLNHTLPLRGITVLRHGYHRLWIGGTNGLGFIDASGNFTRIPLDGAVYDVQPMNYGAIVACESGIYKVNVSGGSERITAYAARTIAARGNTVVYPIEWNVLLLDFEHAKMRLLLPDRRKEPTDPPVIPSAFVRAFDADGITVAQDSAGAVWMNKTGALHPLSEDWKRIAPERTAAITGAAWLNDTLMVSAFSSRGIARLDAGELVFSDELAYGVALNRTGDHTIALTLSGLHHLTVDGWHTHTLPHGIGIPHGLIQLEDGAHSLIVTSAGVFQPDGTPLLTTHNHNPVNGWWGGADHAMIVTAKTLYTLHADRDFDTTPLRLGSAPALTVGEMSGKVAIGSARGLTDAHGKALFEGGLAGAPVTQIVKLADRTWIFTAHGISVCDEGGSNG